MPILMVLSIFIGILTYAVKIGLWLHDHPEAPAQVRESLARFLPAAQATHDEVRPHAEIPEAP
jgi:hypothetical protein